MKVVFILLLDVVLVFGQAPGDSQDICRTNFRYRTPHDWIPYVNDTADGVRGDVKWQVLVDQYDYQHILGQASIPPGVWLQRDIDGDGVQFTQSGSPCTNTLRLRNTFRNSNSNNWVFTQAVNYLDAIEVIVNATVRFTGCQDRSSLNPPCQNNFVTLYRYDTNSERTTNEITNITNFKPCFGDRASSRLEQTGSAIMNEIKTFDRPDFAMTYFGIQDNGTYGDVRRILVYYRVAQGYEDGLVKCPNIPLPKEDSGESVSKNCTCKDNAIPANSLTRTFNGSGHCIDIGTSIRGCDENPPKCKCQPGYQHDETQQVCQACDAGQYGRGGDTSCVACPANSTSTRASGYCSCIEGHFRYDISNNETECEAPPPPMSECTSNTAYDTGAVLQWRNPPHCGGRTDCFYQISINNGPAVRHDPTNFNFNALETYTVDNLQPDTTYSITVSIHNGVSDQDADNTKLRECQIVVTTIPGSVFMLGGTTYLNNTAAIIEHIGEGDMNSLKCTTALETCCRSSGQGDFYYPNGSQVQSGGEDFYRTRSSGSISLNRRGGNTPLGEYRCEIPDGRGILQNLYITIGTNTECPVVCPTCPSCPTTPPPTTCGTPTTCTPSPESSLSFQFGGQTYPNNSVFLMTDIGAGDMALMCVTDHTPCCQTTQEGEWFYPDNTPVSTSGAGMNFYRDRGSQTVRLNRRNNALSPTGRYRCTIPDATGTMQTLVANIIDTSCPQLNDPEHYQVTITPTSISLVLPNSTAMYTCNTGYQLSETSGRRCQNDGTWTGNKPTCEAVTCPELANPENGKVTQNGKEAISSTTVGSEVTYSCNAGYELVGDSSRTCGSNGHWSCDAPECMLVSSRTTTPPTTTPLTTTPPTTTPPTTTPPTTTPDSSTTTSAPLGNTLQFELKGSVYSNGSTISMEDIGEDANALFCRTDRTDCCTGANRLGEFYYPSGSRVGVKKDNGPMYRNRGDQAVLLNRNTNSLNAPPTGWYRCEIPNSNGVTKSISINVAGTGCPQLSDPEHGHVTITPTSSSLVLPNSTAMYTCNTGYQLSETSGRRCQNNGTWTGNEPTCEAVTCPELVNPENGKVTQNGEEAISSTTVGSEVTYSCIAGYELVGDSSRTCGSSGHWSGDAPECIVIDCPQLINPDNGQVTPFGYSPESIALYKCNEGFEIESGHSATRTCGLDGQWSGVPPTCVQSVYCPLLEHPDGGLVTVGGDRTPGSVATYSCDGGYSLLGSTTRECLTNGTWSNKVPTCSQIGFQLNDNFYSSGKVISLSSIGEGDDALQCITDGECCTPPNRAGEFLYPNGTTVRIVGSGDNLYRNRGVRLIRLNRRNDASSPTGTYTCQIPDSSGELQNIFITLN